MVTVKVGRPPRISTGDIAQAALAVGFESLSVAVVARRLGVSPATVHYHVGDRAGLVSLAVDAAVVRMPWPDPRPSWRDYLAACGWAVWRILDEHPGLASIAGEASTTRPPREIYRRFEAAVTQLRDLGFAVDDAFLAVDSVLDLAFDSFARSVQLNVHQPAATHVTAEVPVDPAAASADLAAATAQLVEDSEVRATLVTVLRHGGRHWFARKLDLLLDGVAQLPRRPDPSPAVPVESPVSSTSRERKSRP